ncbi:facilitated trehalose transporter Tret1-like [Calliopsis andreniformis]|uniref:facilitated trehalose transporter Tret1-like n=1 Tax=Calliopsis andreniformis TaxID=337506 RepID=UPI003FCCA6A8
MQTDTEKGRYTLPSGSKRWEYLTIFATSLLAGGVGFVNGWNSPSIVILMAENSPIPVTASAISTLVAMVTIGSTIGPPINTLIVDIIGRKNTMLLTTLPLLVSWGLITIATSIWELYVARFLAGVALGLFICVGPMYIGEISSPDTRESPYFLVMRNKTDEAEGTLEKLRGKTDVSDELQTIVNSLSKTEKEVVKSGRLKDIFTSRGNFRAFIIVTLFSVTQHFGGFFTILIYGQLIFKSIRNVMSDYTINIVIGVTQVISSLITSFLVDRIGRKPLILASGVAAAICNLVIGLFFYAQKYLDVDVQMFTWAPFISSIVLVFTFNCGLVCLQIVLMSEIFATEIKAVATCLVGVMTGILVVFRITPETKGKTFVEIQKKLNKQIGLFEIINGKCSVCCSSLCGILNDNNLSNRISKKSALIWCRMLRVKTGTLKNRWIFVCKITPQNLVVPSSLSRKMLRRKNMPQSNLTRRNMGLPLLCNAATSTLNVRPSIVVCVLQYRKYRMVH